MTLPFLHHTGRAVGIPLDNIDTDVIIPMQWLLSVPRGELGRHAFHPLRYDAEGVERPDFPLNSPRGRGASVIVGGRNFGCGSSREGAVYALVGLNIRAVIASSYGDIFFSNCIKNGVLPIQLPHPDVERIHAAMAACPEPMDTAIDLERQMIALSSGLQLSFEIDPANKRRLIDGTDEVTLTLLAEDEIVSFERKDKLLRPWVYCLNRRADKTTKPNQETHDE
ncbi:MAG: 3-isopropylmalate dehydratase small subunit [Burkholderiaceae bacterium]|nr:3-isopropylmalate dehydratase small subunit [Burkholderiaceae bacterium]